MTLIGTVLARGFTLEAQCKQCARSWLAVNKKECTEAEREIVAHVLTADHVVGVARTESTDRVIDSLSLVSSVLPEIANNPIMSKHQQDCRWQRTTDAECEYRATHHYCPHAEHACTCVVVTGGENGDPSHPANTEWDEYAVIRRALHGFAPITDATYNRCVAYLDALRTRSEENDKTIATLRDTIRRVEEWRAMTALDSDKDAALVAALRPDGAT